MAPVTDTHWIWGSNDSWCTLAQLQGGQCSEAGGAYTIPAGQVETGSTITAGSKRVAGPPLDWCDGQRVVSNGPSPRGMIQRCKPRVDGLRRAKAETRRNARA